ncbi:rCG63300 [Rattus norvegicus]|uniref:RCG63300 n=1 Tax=Rattus norvegicus TaxID=10116 RepID=A6JXR0_RAT|nr:rCG63300 [Rattus norvegicus]
MNGWQECPPFNVLSLLLFPHALKKLFGFYFILFIFFCVDIGSYYVTHGGFELSCVSIPSAGLQVCLCTLGYYRRFSFDAIPFVN